MTKEMCPAHRVDVSLSDALQHYARKTSENIGRGVSYQNIPSLFCRPPTVPTYATCSRISSL